MNHLQNFVHILVKNIYKKKFHIKIVMILMSGYNFQKKNNGDIKKIIVVKLHILLFNKLTTRMKLILFLME